MNVDDLAAEITAAAEVVHANRADPDVLRVILMPNVRRLAVLVAEVVAADEKETAEMTRRILDSIFTAEGTP